MDWDPTWMQSPVPWQSWLQRPWTESNCNSWAAVAASPPQSLMGMMLIPGRPHRARKTKGPMRPKPLMPMLIVVAAQEPQDRSTVLGGKGVPRRMSVSAAPQFDSDQARALLKALADPLRLQVIEALSGGERWICDLASALELGQSKLSFHLKVLKQAGLLADRQEGRNRHPVSPPNPPQDLIPHPIPDSRSILIRVLVPTWLPHRSSEGSQPWIAIYHSGLCQPWSQSCSWAAGFQQFRPD